MRCRNVYGKEFDLAALVSELASQKRNPPARYDLTREGDTAVLTATLLLEPELTLWTARYEIIPSSPVTA